MEYIIPIVLIEAFGDYNLAEYVKTNSNVELGMGFASYGAVLLIFIQSIRTMGLAWSNAAWDGWSNLATGLVAVVILKERPSSMQIGGMLLVFIGLVMLGLHGTKVRAQ